MKRTILVVAALALLVPVTFSGDSNLGAPLKLTLVGPRFVHRGQKLKSKAVLTNSSSAPIILASRDASLDFDLDWKITDSYGLEERKPFVGFACPVGGPGWNENLVRRMKDSDLTLLQPGGKLEFVYDVSADYILLRPGKYQVRASYTYVPPRIDGGDGTKRDRFGQKYDLTELSPQTLANAQACLYTDRDF